MALKHHAWRTLEKVSATPQTADKVLASGGGFFYNASILIDKDTRQISMEFASIEELAQKDHLLRKINKAIDFGFIREKVRGLYCADNGRPAIDPVVLFKMLFIGYLFGVRSGRQLVRDIKVNVTYRRQNHIKGYRHKSDYAIR